MKEYTVDNNKLLRSPVTSEYKSNYREIFGHSLSTGEKGRFYLVDGKWVPASEYQHPQDRKHFQFEPYYHIGLGKWIRSKKHYSHELNKIGATEVGDVSYQEYAKYTNPRVNKGSRI